MLFSISYYAAAALLLITSLQYYLHEASAFSLTHEHLSCHNQIIKLQNHKSHTILFATSSNEESSPTTTATTNTSKSARERGIYARPSAAIERGSGFFIPGLEGPRIRILFGITVLIADWANHTFAESQLGDYGQIIAEVLAAFYGALLLLQGLIESGVGEIGSRGNNSNNLVIEGNGDGVDNNDVDNAMKGTTSSGVSPIIQGNESTLKSMQRLARTIVNLTPATHFILANEEDGVLYRYGIWVDGDNKSGDNYTDEDRSIIKLALDAAGSSRAGRVALPSDHPASKLLPTSATRCILVQSIDIDGYGSDNGGKSCLIIGSDKLLPAYTKNDLRWIGQLALHQP